MSFETTPIERFLTALERYVAARDEMNKCYASCDSSPDYFCAGEVTRVKEAREEVGKMFAIAVREVAATTESTDAISRP